MSVRVLTYSAAQVRGVEKPLLEAGVPLMRRAASALAGVVRSELSGVPSGRVASSIVLEPLLQDDPDAPRPRVLALVGSGDNGGDALYAAAELGDVADVDVLLVGSRVHEPAFAAAAAGGARRIELLEVRDARYAVVLDGILGIGASGGLHGLAREAVEGLGSVGSQVIAVDVPSGLQPDTGAADDAVLAASITVTFGAVKAGLALGRGPELAGEVVLVDLGLSFEGVEAVGEAEVARVVDARG